MSSSQLEVPDAPHNSRDNSPKPCPSSGSSVTTIVTACESRSHSSETSSSGTSGADMAACVEADAPESSNEALAMARQASDNPLQCTHPSHICLPQWQRTDDDDDDEDDDWFSPKGPPSGAEQGIRKPVKP
ncbi:hypothetical protein K466DRAFT_653869 [Polyporus arcularius HHB13444]|uniref:Uncharacterized protein n=1 Tax=Polyporus arcularius HHB13444 TaxID=1314778 RepID=A0A5C3PJI3_9APHY|nr:hypothetical protein K466DRAFT_653869 [Polyporus arcularius HHB13444]